MQQVLASIRSEGRSAYIRESVSSPWGRIVQDCDADTENRPVEISLKNMVGVHEIDCANMTARIGPGISFGQLRLALESTGLEWPVQELPGQTLVAEAVLGGVAKVNSSLFPDIRPWVLGATIVTGEMNIVHSGGSTIKNSSGYALTRALVGSHGVFGVPTDIRLRLRPETKASSLTLHGSHAMYEALEAAISDPGMILRLEIRMDQTSILTTIHFASPDRNKWFYSLATERADSKNKGYGEGSIAKTSNIGKIDHLIIPRNNDFMIKWQASPHRCCQTAENIIGLGSARGMLILPLQRMGFAVSDDASFLQFIQETGLEFNKLPFSESAVRALHENPIVLALNPEGVLR